MNKNIVLFLALQLVFSNLFSQKIVWKPVENMPAARRNLSAISLDNCVYAIGGNGGKKSNYKLDLNTMTWSSKAEKPTGCSNLALAEVNGNIYAIGGDRLLDKNEMYDPQTDTWTTMTPMLTARQHVKCGVVDGKIYVMGGLTILWSEITNKNEMYNPQTNSWTEMAPLPIPIHGPHQNIISIDSMIYVISGKTYEGSDIWKNTKAVQAYNTITNTWATKTDMPLNYMLATFKINKDIFVIGEDGEDETSTYNSDIYKYTPQTDTWEKHGHLPTGIKWQAGVTTVGNEIVFICGGNDDEMIPRPDVMMGTVESLVNSAKATYIANAGFLIETNYHKILIDALFSNGYGELPVPSPELRENIVNGMGLFDNIDLLLVTHNHQDHYNATLVADQLANNNASYLIGPNNIKASLTSNSQSESYSSRLITITPDYNMPTDTVVKNMNVDILRMQHIFQGTPFENNAYFVEVDGINILHVGDFAGDALADFEKLNLDQRNIDIAFINYNGYFDGADKKNRIKSAVNAKQTILYHMPFAEINSVLDSCVEWSNTTAFRNTFEGIYYSKDTVIYYEIVPWISDNSRPKLMHALEDLILIAGENSTFQIPENTFIDNDTLTYAAMLSNATDLPDWLEFDPTSKIFSGMPSSAGTLEIIVTATDNYQESISDTFNLIINEPSNVNNLLKNNLLTYPNPANDIIIVRCENIELIKGYQLLCMNGEIVKCGELKSNIIDVKGLSSGVYLLNLITNKGLTSKKVVIE